MNQLANDKASSDQDHMDHMDALHDALSYMPLSAPGLAIGSASKLKVKIVNTTVFLHNGLFKSKATAEVVFTATTDDITADASTVQERCYVLSLQADGTPTLTPGTVASGTGNAVVPDAPAAETGIGYLRLAVAAGSTDFDATTDELDEGHLTDTYVDFGFRFPRFDAAFEVGGVTAA